MGLLTGYRVLDFGRFIAGPYAAALLGDMGADVIRIERLEGGEDRCVLPVAESGEGGMFLQINRNKRCLTLDLASAQGREIVRKLIKTADVVVANLPTPTLKQLGLDYATVSALNPRCVLVTVNAYGTVGPWSQRPGFDGVGQAMSGAMYMTGTPDAPRRAITTYIDFSTAQACAMGALAALWARDKAGPDGKGQLVEGSLLRSAVIQTNGLLIEQSVREADRIPQGNRGFAASPSDAFKTKTGWLLIQTIGDAMFLRICDLIGKPEMKTDPRFADDVVRGNNSAEISRCVGEWCASLTREEALDALAKAKLPSGPIYTPRETLEDAQIKATELLPMRSFPGMSHPYPVAPHPVDMSATPAEFRFPAPQLGEHTDEVLRELGFDAGAIAGLRERKVV
jgi:crotonobetainyl-CoA:carnitine CoA-transferase CaiB-like acyl-CoA transferase